MTEVGYRTDSVLKRLGSVRKEVILMQDDDQASPYSTPRFPEFYTDSTQVHVSTFGFTLEFGVSLPDESSQPGLVRPVARAYLSPQHAKALALTLKAFVREYESTVGEIALPAELMARFNSKGA